METYSSPISRGELLGGADGARAPRGRAAARLTVEPGAEGSRFAELRQLAAHRRGVGADRGQQRRGDAVALGEQRAEQVGRADIGVAGQRRGLHGGGDRLLRLGGGVEGVHPSRPPAESLGSASPDTNVRKVESVPLKSRSDDLRTAVTVTCTRAVHASHDRLEVARYSDAAGVTRCPARAPRRRSRPRRRPMTAEQLLDHRRRRAAPRAGAVRSMVAIIRSSFDARRPAGRGARPALLRDAVRPRPRDPRPLPGEHGGAAQQAAARARARRADGGPARRARPVPAAARPRPPQVRRARRALRRRRRRAARRRRALRRADAWTPEVEKAWTEAYGMVAARDAHRRRGRARAGLLAGPGGRATGAWAGTSPVITVQTSEADPVPGGPVRERRDAAAAAAVALPLARQRAARATACWSSTSGPCGSGWVSRAIVAHSPRRRHLAHRAADGPAERRAATSGTQPADGRGRHRHGARSRRCWRTSRSGRAPRAPRSSSAAAPGTTSTTSTRSASCPTTTPGSTSCRWSNGRRRGSGGAERGTLADVVTRYGAWADHDVLVCGSPAMIRATVTPDAGGGHAARPDPLRPVHGGLTGHVRRACRRAAWRRPVARPERMRPARPRSDRHGRGRAGRRRAPTAAACSAAARAAGELLGQLVEPGAAARRPAAPAR